MSVPPSAAVAATGEARPAAARPPCRSPWCLPPAAREMGAGLQGKVGASDVGRGLRGALDICSGGRHHTAAATAGGGCSMPRARVTLAARGRCTAGGKQCQNRARERRGMCPSEKVPPGASSGPVHTAEMQSYTWGRWSDWRVGRGAPQTALQLKRRPAGKREGPVRSYNAQMELWATWRLRGHLQRHRRQDQALAILQ